jgi:hypothetical protein
VYTLCRVYTGLKPLPSMGLRRLCRLCRLKANCAPHFTDKNKNKKNRDTAKKFMSIFPGSKITGLSGKTLIVDRIEGEILICGDRRIKLSAVVNIEPPQKAPAPLAVGDIAYYCGEQFWQQYRGMPLVLLEKREGLWICEKPDGYRTTNLSARELSRSPASQPKVNTSSSPQKGQWLKDWESEQR